jgi:hypothetical protein
MRRAAAQFTSSSAQLCQQGGKLTLPSSPDFGRPIAWLSCSKSAMAPPAADVSSRYLVAARLTSSLHFECRCFDCQLVMPFYCFVTPGRSSIPCKARPAFGHPGCSTEEVGDGKSVPGRCASCRWVYHLRLTCCWKTDIASAKHHVQNNSLTPTYASVPWPSVRLFHNLLTHVGMQGNQTPRESFLVTSPIPT